MKREESRPLSVPDSLHSPHTLSLLFFVLFSSLSPCKHTHLFSFSGHFIFYRDTLAWFSTKFSLFLSLTFLFFYWFSSSFSWWLNIRTSVFMGLWERVFTSLTSHKQIKMNEPQNLNTKIKKITNWNREVSNLNSEGPSDLDLDRLDRPGSEVWTPWHLSSCSAFYDPSINMIRAVIHGLDWISPSSIILTPPHPLPSSLLINSSSHWSWILGHAFKWRPKEQKTGRV